LAGGFVPPAAPFERVGDLVLEMFELTVARQDDSLLKRLFAMILSGGLAARRDHDHEGFWLLGQPQVFVIMGRCRGRRGLEVA
jgi:hypothetical protein